MELPEDRAWSASRDDFYLPWVGDRDAVERQKQLNEEQPPIAILERTGQRV